MNHNQSNHNCHVSLTQLKSCLPPLSLSAILCSLQVTTRDQVGGPKTPHVLGCYGSCGSCGCDLFSASIFLKSAKNGLHGLPGLFRLPAIHTIRLSERGTQDFSCVRLFWQLWMLWLRFILSKLFLNLPLMVFMVCLVSVVHLQFTQ